MRRCTVATPVGEDFASDTEAGEMSTSPLHVDEDFATETADAEPP